jgi:hypothetical protein
LRAKVKTRINAELPLAISKAITTYCNDQKTRTAFGLLPFCELRFDYGAAGNRRITS